MFEVKILFFQTLSPYFQFLLLLWFKMHLLIYLLSNFGKQNFYAMQYCIQINSRSMWQTQRIKSVWRKHLWNFTNFWPTINSRMFHFWCTPTSKIFLIPCRLRIQRSPQGSILLKIGLGRFRLALLAKELASEMEWNGSARVLRKNRSYEQIQRSLYRPPQN